MYANFSQLVFRMLVVHYLYQKGVQLLEGMYKKDEENCLPIDINDVNPLPENDEWGFYDTDFY